MKKFRITLLALAIIAGSASLGAWAKSPQLGSTKYLYDQCSDALSKNEFKGSYCAIYIGAFRDGYAVSGYLIASESYKNNLQDKIKRSSDCHPKDPDNLEEFAKLYISWVDEQRSSTEVQYDILKADSIETVGSMVMDKLTCLNKPYHTTNATPDTDTEARTEGVHCEKSGNNIDAMTCYMEREAGIKKLIVGELGYIYENLTTFSGERKAEEIKNNIRKSHAAWDQYFQNHCAYFYINEAMSHPPSQSLNIARCRYTKAKERLNEIKTVYRIHH